MSASCDRDVFGFKQPLFLALCMLIAFGSRAADVVPNRKVRFREPRETSYVLVGAASHDWTAARREGGSAAQIELGSRIVLQIKAGTDLDGLLRNRGLALSRTISSNLFILQAADSRGAIDAAESLASVEGVVASYPVMRRAMRHHNAYAPLPNDSYFSQQWHLENR